MATSIQKLDFLDSTNTKTITYHSNDPDVTTVYTSWTEDTETRYRFYAADLTVSDGGNALLFIDVDGTYAGKLSVVFNSSIGGYWNGTGYYDGIQISMTLFILSTHNIDEDFTLKKSFTLQDGDMKYKDSTGTHKVYKVQFKNATSTYTVFHEAIKTPTYYSSSKSTTSITWYFKNEDADIAVDMWARIGTNSFTEMASNVAAGANGTLAFTGLSSSTSYNIDVYCVPAGTDDKLNSEQATDTRTTDSPAVKAWIYQGTTGTQTYSWGDTGLNPFTCAKYPTFQSQNFIDSNYPAANYSIGIVARIYISDSTVPFPYTCYHYYKVEWD